jgi:hypothetical protein
LFLAAGLTAVFILSQISSGTAASAYHSVSTSASSHSPNASYSSNSNASRAEEPVPPNCVRQSCGKLWCWQMKNGGH